MSHASPLCPSCRSAYAPGTSRCGCGRSLDGAAAVPISETGLPSLTPFGPPPVLRLCLAEAAGRPVLFRGRPVTQVPLGARHMVVGRSDARTGSYPEIDICALPGAEYVSRSHAEVYLDDDGDAFVIDRKGEGGTTVTPSGTVLLPDEPVKLAPGDSIVLADEVTLSLVERAEE